MINKFTPCCRKCSTGGFYFEIRNKTTFFSFFTIEYRLKDKVFKKQSPLVAPGKKEHLLFPRDVQNVIFTVYNAGNLPPTIIASLTVLAHENICYEVTGNIILSQCIRVLC